MLSKFDKAREQTANDLGVAKYEKDDFFDTMSSDARKRKQKCALSKMAEQRKVDSETFGREGAAHTAFTVAEEVVAEVEAEEAGGHY